MTRAAYSNPPNGGRVPRLGPRMSQQLQQHKKQRDMNETSRKNLKPWKPGQSGNPKGRPLGSRHKNAEAIIRDIAADWEVNGVAALAELAKTDVAAYCKLAAGLIPKEFNLALATPMPGGLDVEDWAIALETFS